MLKAIVKGLARHAVSVVGGVLLARGILDAEQVTAIVGGAAALVAAVGSILDKKKNTAPT